MRRALAALILAAPLAACDGDTAGDMLAFDRMDVTELSWTDIESDFVFALDNPLLVDLEVARFDYTLDLAGADVAFGEAADGIIIGAGQGELAFPVGLQFAEVYEMVEASKGEDTVPFVFSGSVGFDTAIGPIDLPFNAEGDFPALRTPKVTLAALKVADLSWSGAALDIGIDVDNEHGSTLLFNNLDYGLRIEGQDVASGLVQQLGSANAGTTRVDLPVNVDFLEAGAAAVSALSGSGQVDVGLAATADVETPFGTLPLTIDSVEGLSLSN